MNLLFKSKTLLLWDWGEPWQVKSNRRCWFALSFFESHEKGWPWSKQPVSRNNGSVYLYKVLRDFCTISSLTGAVHKIAHVLVQMTRGTFASRLSQIYLSYLPQAHALFQVFPPVEETKYKHYRRVQGKPICSVNLRYHCSVLQEW